MKKQWLMTVLIALLAVLLVACGGGAATPTEMPPAPTDAPAAEPTDAPAAEPTDAPAAPTEAPPSGPDVSIRIWADDTRAPILQELGAEFEAAYGVGLVVEQVADIRDQFVIAAPAGEGPDIIIGAHDWLGQLVGSGLLAPIELGAKADLFTDVALTGFTYDERIYGMPYATENLAFFYNTDMVDTAPTTWDEVISVGEALVDAGEATFALVLTGTTYDAFPLQTAFGGYIFGRDAAGNYDPTDVGVDSAGMIASGDFIADNVAAGLISDNTDWDTAHVLFETGEVPFIMAGPWALDRLRAAGIPYAIANFPAADGGEGRPFAGVQGFMVNALSDNVLLAQTFLTEFVATDATMKALADAGNRPSAFSDVLAATADADLVAFGEAGRDAVLMPAIPEMGSVWGSWGDAFSLIIQGQESSRSALGTAANQIRDLIGVPTVEMPEEPDGEMMDACNGVDLTGEEIVIYQQAGREGPLAAILGNGFAFATTDALTYINDNGGVCGATLTVEFCESNYNPELEIACYEQFRAADPTPIILLSYGSGATIALKDRVLEDEIIHMVAGLDAGAMYDPADGYTYAGLPIYSDQFAGFLQWASDNWADIKPENAGDEIVVGVVGWANAFGSGATTPEALAYAESIGVTVLPVEQQEIRPDFDASGPLQNLLLQGANVIWNQNLSFGSTQVIGAARALGVWDTEVIVAGVNWSFNTDVVNFLGATPQAANGYYGVMPHPWYNDTDLDIVQVVNDAYVAGGYAESDRGVSYITAFDNFVLIDHLLEATIGSVGYENLSGATVKQTMEELGTVQGGGVLTIDASDGRRAPSMAQIRQMQFNGTGIDFVVIEDFFELPDTRPAQ